MKYLENIETKDSEPKEASQNRWLIVFLGAESMEIEINSIIAKARNLRYRDIQKPEYLLPFNVIQTIENSYVSGNIIKEILDNYVHNKSYNRYERVAVVFDRESFNSEDTFKQVVRNLRYIPICSNPSADYTLTQRIEVCKKGICSDCSKEIICQHNCIYRLIQLLLYGSDFNTFELSTKLIKAVRNSYLNGNMNTIVMQILNEHGIAYVAKKHLNDALTCIDVARERGVSLSQILKCMVGKDINGGIHIMLLPGDKMLKFKKLHKITGIKINFVSPEELTIDYGLTVGAISPIQFMGRAKFYLEQTVLREKNIDISSGSLDIGIMLKTEDLRELINPTICDIV